jgi:hypothetical protein
VNAGANADSTERAASSRPEGLLGAALGFVALALVVGLAIATFGLKLGENDVSALLADVLPDLAEEPLPLGLEHVGGSALAGESRWLVLERRADLAPEAVDANWPQRVVFGRFGDALSARRLFDPVLGNVPRDLREELEAWEKKPYRFEAVTRREALTFGTHETDYLVVRTFEKDRTFFDTVRVDLTVGQVGQVLDAMWPTGFEGADAKVLVPLLERLVLPKPVVPAAPDAEAASDAAAAAPAGS